MARYFRSRGFSSTRRRFKFYGKKRVDGYYYEGKFYANLSGGEWARRENRLLSTLSKLSQKQRDAYRATGDEKYLR